MRLDRLLQKLTRQSNKQVLKWLEQGQVQLDGRPCLDGRAKTTEFSQIQLNGEAIYGKHGQYWLMNKDAGVLSATSDPQHPTVIEALKALQPDLDVSDIHIAGRLDRATTGLLILTNDGRWSKKLTRPEVKIPKRYLVTTQNPIAPEAETRFREGIYFAYEDITTSPAELTLINETQAWLTIYEGKYHQIKRMFGTFRNPVIGLHRTQMGQIHLEADLALGQARPLTSQEIEWLN